MGPVLAPAPAESDGVTVCRHLHPSVGLPIS